MVPTFWTCLLLGSLNLVLTLPTELTEVPSPLLNSTSLDSEPDESLSPVLTTVSTVNATEKTATSGTEDEISKPTKDGITEIIEKLDEKVEDGKVEDKKVVLPVNSSVPAEGFKVVLVGGRSNLPKPEDHFHYYTQPKGFDYPIDPVPLNAYNLRRAEVTRGTFSVFDYLTSEHTSGVPLRQLLEGPINIAIPLLNREMSLYFVNRGLKSVKYTPSLRPISDALTRHVRKIGLTIPAALSLRSRYLSWPVRNVVFAEPVFLADISNTATYPTVLFIPEDDMELTRMTPDLLRIGDFSLLEEGIRYTLPTQKHIY